MFSSWLDDLLVRYRTMTGRNITSIRCSTETYLMYFAPNKHTKLFCGGYKKYRTAYIQLDDTLSYQEIKMR